MENRFFLFVTILLFIGSKSFSQEDPGEFSILFYNVENLFDLDDDPLTSDEEFTPSGDRHWTYKRLNTKLLNLSKVILSSSGWKPPGVVALCEIENRKVLELLTGKTPLKPVNYQIIHKESPDHRGIDVALLYQPEMFEPIAYRYYPLKYKNDSIVNTREILYVTGVANGKDTLHLFVNHWPSRYSGLLETKPIRNEAAKLLRQKVNELFQKYVSPKIIIMGDFNDQPTDESIADFLDATKIDDKTESKQLYNLSFPWLESELGTLKYQLQWSVFDQIIVSGALLNSTSGLFAKPNNATIIKQPFLLEKDEKFGGLKPKRSYIGFTYNGGFSDHLPIVLKLYSRN